MGLLLATLAVVLAGALAPRCTKDRIEEARPISCELWPGDTSDVTPLVPVARRLQTRFGRSGLWGAGGRQVVPLPREGWQVSALQEPAGAIRCDNDP